MSIKAAFCLVVIIVSFRAVPVSSLDKVRVATSSPSVGSFPFFLAHKKGFYQSEGIDAEIIFVRANIAITALVTDEVDFVTFFGSTLRASLRGLPVKNVMVVMTGADHFLVTRPEIRGWNDFRGKKIAISSPGTTTEAEVKAGLKTAGFQSGDVSILSFGGQETRMAALESRAVDATVLDSVRAAIMNRRGFRSLANLGEINRTPFMGLGVSHRKIKNNPDVIRRMARGTAGAVRYIRDNPADAQKMMEQILAIRDAEVARNIYHLVVGLYNDKVLPGSVIQAAVDEERAQLGLQRVPPLSDVIDWSFVRDLDERR
jgi:NitT/TauT family transport system substrate-binding protein